MALVTMTAVADEGRKSPKYLNNYESCVVSPFVIHAPSAGSLMCCHVGLTGAAHFVSS